MHPLDILIVDDDVDVAESLALVIEGRGHRVEIVHSGEDALLLFRVKPFDLTVMDVKLPGINGVDCFLEMQKTAPAARVILMTGYNVAPLCEKAIQHGVLSVLLKPLDLIRLFSLIDSIPGMVTEN